MATVTVRPATEDDLHELHWHLHDQRDYFEQQNLRNAIVMVLEQDGAIVGFGAARLAWWQVEPILLTRDFKKHGSKHAQRKGTYLLIRELDRWIGDRSKNLSGIHSYFCSIKGRTMQKLALSFGMLHIYRRCKFFGRDA
jgi:hypothetical protein